MKTEFICHSWKSFWPVKNDSAADDEELKGEDKHARKSSKYQELRNYKSMKASIVDMFDHESDITDVESNIFKVIF